MHYDVTGMVAKGVTVASIAMLLLTGFLLLVWNYKNTTSIPDNTPFSSLSKENIFLGFGP